MGKYRRVQDKFWSDSKVQGLSPLDKLLFLYLITNEHLSASGLYPITYRTIGFETGMDEAQITSSMGALEGVELVRYDGSFNVVWVVNFFRYQDRTPNNIKSAGTDLSHCKKSFLVNDFVKAYESLGKALGKAPIGIGIGIEYLKGVKKEEYEEKEKGVEEALEEPFPADLQEGPQPEPKGGGLKRAGMRRQIIDYLNERLGTTYRPETKATVQHLDARIGEGYTLDDFVAVIDSKVELWGSDPAMADYLRPTTLFGSKFESYLQAARRPALKPKNLAVEKATRGITEWLAEGGDKDAKELRQDNGYALPGISAGGVERAG